MKIKNAIKEYLTEIEIRKYSERTIKSYKNNLATFLRFCEEVEEINDMDEITLPTVRRFTGFFVKAGRKATYINSMLKVVKSFLTYIWDEYEEGFNPRNKFKWCKEEKPAFIIFKPADVKKIVNNCKGNTYLDLRDMAIITCLFETGIRNIELCGIMNEDIHDDFILIRGKNHKERVVPITAPLRKALIRYDRAKQSYFALKHTDKNYFLSYRGKGLTVEAVEHTFTKRGEGIEGVRVSPHSARHFFAIKMLQNGVDIYSISRLLGHESLQITQRYLSRLTNEDLIKETKHNSVLMNL